MKLGVREFFALPMERRHEVMQWVVEQAIDDGGCEGFTLAVDGDRECVRFHMIRRQRRMFVIPIERYDIDIFHPTRPCPWPFGVDKSALM